MNSFSNLEIGRIFLSVPSWRRRWEALVTSASLLPGEEPSYVVGVTDCDGNLAGTASLDGDIIKYVAIGKEYRGEAIMNSLISHLVSYAASMGINKLFVFTKPEYERLFASLNFKTVGRSEYAVLLENCRDGIESYAGLLEKCRREALPDGQGTAGVIVMNANPPTQGHLHLIRQSAAKVDHLFVIPLADNVETRFSYEARRKALMVMTENIGNVTVLPGSPYCISRFTFPTYFIKKVSDQTDAYITLDLDIFLRHIAPALNASVRFVGEEPDDDLTARYNLLMTKILPLAGVRVEVIRRITDVNGVTISASKIRKALEAGRLRHIVHMIPPASLPAILAKAACKALRDELDLTPKPGLVDRDDSGSHTDMNYEVMTKGISALEPVFEAIARMSMTVMIPSATVLSEIGMAGEQAMFKATGGVNTHKGALFSQGLAVSAAAHILSNSVLAVGEKQVMDVNVLTSSALHDTISRIAGSFPRPANTHGSAASSTYNIPTAIDMARCGYSPLMSDCRGEQDPYRRLLMIMSCLEDSNVYHRGGCQGAEFVKTNALRLLEETQDMRDGSGGNIMTQMKAFNVECIKRNLSPGGAADMLSLSFLFDTLLL